VDIVRGARGRVPDLYTKVSFSGVILVAVETDRQFYGH
jgi:hypothetical protein